jgi:hypothetical protein
LRRLSIPAHLLLLQQSAESVFTEREIIMKSHVGSVLIRALLYSFLAAVAAGIIYIIIALVQGMKWNGETLGGSLITGAISFVIALVFFSGFMLYFARKRA